MLDYFECCFVMKGVKVPPGLRRGTTRVSSLKEHIKSLSIETSARPPVLPGAKQAAASAPPRRVLPRRARMPRRSAPSGSGRCAHPPGPSGRRRRRRAAPTRAQRGMAAPGPALRPWSAISPAPLRCPKPAPFTLLPPNDFFSGVCCCSCFSSGLVLQHLLLTLLSPPATPPRKPGGLPKYPNFQPILFRLRLGLAGIVGTGRGRECGGRWTCSRSGARTTKA
jgi:hypothetical protein